MNCSSPAEIKLSVVDIVLAPTITVLLLLGPNNPKNLLLPLLVIVIASALF
jgi:hypothetical protein